MGSKVTLIYENGKYTVEINGVAVEVKKDLEESIEKFKSVIKNNVNATERSWTYIEEKVRAFNNKNVEINTEYKTITIGEMKYFYTTGKVFYIGENNLIPLSGGYEFVKFILKTEALSDLEVLNKFLKLCKSAVESKATYRTGEEYIAIFSAAFNYGSVEYNFTTKKMNKGVAINSATFEEFIKYVLSIIKK